VVWGTGSEKRIPSDVSPTAALLFAFASFLDFFINLREENAQCVKNYQSCARYFQRHWRFPRFFIWHRLRWVLAR
jgi:hypothetical protein